MMLCLHCIHNMDSWGLDDHFLLLWEGDAKVKKGLYFHPPCTYRAKNMLNFWKPPIAFVNNHKRS